MNAVYQEEEVVVHPVGGMQLAVGYIRMDNSRHCEGQLPGMATLKGTSVEDVLHLMDLNAKEFYGDDVVVEITHHVSAT